MTVASRSNASWLTVLTLFGLALASMLIPAGLADAKVKPKNGIYYQGSPNPEKNPYYGYITVEKGKIATANVNMSFKTNAGKLCRPDGYNSDRFGNANIYFDVARKVKPDSKGKFKVTNTRPDPVFKTLKATIEGKFKSANKASFKVVLKGHGCTASRYFGKALFTAGG